MMWKQAKRIGLVAAAGLMVVPLAGNAGTAKAAT